MILSCSPTVDKISLFGNTDIPVLYINSNSTYRNLHNEIYELQKELIMNYNEKLRQKRDNLKLLVFIDSQVLLLNDLFEGLPTSNDDQS